MYALRVMFGLPELVVFWGYKHFIEGYNRRSFVLAFRQLKYKQTYYELATTIDSILSELQTPSEIITNIVTDGGSGFCKAFRVFGKSQDTLVETNITEEADIEELAHIENSDASERNIVLENLPYMQQSDGELLFSNILTFDRNNLYELPSTSRNEPNAENISSDLEGHEEDNDEINFFHDIAQADQPEQNIQRKDIILPPQRRCLSHLLNLVYSDFEKKLSCVARSALVNSISKLHALWIFTHRSSHAKTICLEILGRALKVPCETRRNSKKDAIELACSDNVKPKINPLIENLKEIIKGAGHLQKLSQNDWIILKEYLNVMQPVARSLDRLQSEKDGAQGYILPTLFALKHHVDKVGGNNIANQFKTAMTDVINDRFGNYLLISESNRELILATATLPKFKNYFVDSDSEKHLIYQMLKTECNRIIEDNSVSEAENENFSNVDHDDDFYVTFHQPISNRRVSIESEIELEVANYFNDSK